MKEIDQLRVGIPEKYLKYIDAVWSQKDEFIRWPDRTFLFMPGVVRIKYHSFSDEQREVVRSAGFTPDSRSNGPAINAFQVAGGERPERTNGNGWSIHHIYDGKFPFSSRGETIRAVTHGDYFTDAAGLVAAHPIADALAGEFAYFAWLLRLEAFERFSFDPDGVLNTQQ